MVPGLRADGHSRWQGGGSHLLGPVCTLPPQVFGVPHCWVGTLTLRLLWVSPCGMRESGRATREHSDNGEEGD